MNRTRNLLSLLRPMRWLRRAVLAAFIVATLQSTLLPCAMAFQSATAADMTEHCVYCPDVSGHDRQDNGGCKFSHAPAMSASSANQPLAVGAALDAPPTVAGVVPDFRHPPASKSAPHLLYRTLSPPRPIALTYCVQLK